MITLFFDKLFRFFILLLKISFIKRQKTVDERL